VTSSYPAAVLGPLLVLGLDLIFAPAITLATARLRGQDTGVGSALVRRHQVPRHVPRALDPRAKLRYLRAVEAWPGTRDRAIEVLPLYAGTRIAEIRALDVADARLSARKGELHLVGKGEKSRTVPVHPKLRQALAAWLAGRPSRPGADLAALFISAGAPG